MIILAIFCILAYAFAIAILAIAAWQGNLFALSAIVGLLVSAYLTYKRYHENQQH